MKKSNESPGPKRNAGSHLGKVRDGARSVATRPAGGASKTPLDVAQPARIVGIGLSAGGLEAFWRLLASLPVDTGMAFVLVQNLEPNHDSILAELLAKATAMPVHEVREGMSAEPNHVYVVPANADLSLMDGLLHIVGRKAVGQGARAALSDPNREGLLQANPADYFP